MAVRLQEIFAHAMAPQLSFVAFFALESRWKQNEIFIKFEFRWKSL